MTTIVLNDDTGSYEDNMSADAGSWSEPYESLIFIAVQWNGDDFSFLNALHKRFGFKADRWAPFKDVLRPFTFHCFKVEGYRAGSASGSGFRPVEHIAEFPGIDVARMFNRAYLTFWQEFHNDEDIKNITHQTTAFVEKMKSFDTTYAGVVDYLAETVEQDFRDDLSSIDFKAVLALTNLDRHEIVIDGDFFENVLGGYDGLIE
jgi:hypothetical protein